MKIRRYAVYLILLIIVLILIILIPKSETEKAGLNKYKPVTITYANGYGGSLGDSINDLINEFNKTEGKRVGIFVKHISYGGNVKYLSDIVKETILSGLPNDSICDINTVTYETAYFAKTMNKIASPDDYLDKSVLSEYIQGYLERGRYTSDSKRGVFPILNHTQVIYVNDVIWSRFKEAYPRYQDDVFETWEGIVEASIDYYDWTDSLTPDIKGDGKAFIIIDSLKDYIFTGSNQLTSSIIQPGHREVRINLDRGTLRRIWETVYKGYLYGGISIENYNINTKSFKNNITSYDLMADGKVACYIDYTSNVNNFPFAFKDVNNAKETKLKVFGFPYFKNQKEVSPISGEGLVVMKTESKREYACFYFLNWLVSQNEYISACYDNMAIPVKSKSISSSYSQTLITNAIESKEIKKKYRGLVLKEASEQIHNYEAYAPIDFSKSLSFIDEIVDSFYFNVDLGLKEVNSLTSSGVDRKEAIEIVSKEEAFESWYFKITNIAGKY